MARASGPWGSALRTPVGACGAALIALFVILAVLAPVLWGEHAAEIDLGSGSGHHILGTDALGRDVFYRVLVATRLSIGLALAAAIMGLSVGITLGALPSVLGHRTGRAITAVINLAVAFPGLLVVLVFAVIFGVGTTGAVLAIGLAMAPSFARLTRTLAASVEGLDYVAAARVAGVARGRLLVRHILPNVAEPLVVNATLAAGGALLTFSGLSFLGLGVQPPDYDWGRLLGEGLNRIYVEPTAALAPAAAVVLAGLGFSMFGELAAKALSRSTSGGSTSGGSRPGGSTGRRRPKRGASAPAGPLRHAPIAPDELLTVDNLQLSVPAAQGWMTPVRGVSFRLHRGEAVGLVGESGSGKSLTAMAIAGLTEPPVRVTANRLTFEGESLLPPRRALRRLLGTSLAVVFQDPASSFNPAKRIGRQLAEVAEVHHNLTRRDASERAVARLRTVHLSAPRRRARQYPHELSGGMRQRAMIAMGLMSQPTLIIADEPTTALDPTVQHQILALFAEVRHTQDTAIVLISHDLAVVEQLCERILVMYAGRIVEDLPSRDLAAARHPYTRALLATVPHLDTDTDAPLAVIEGSPPDPARLPPGCAFAPRCRFAGPQCTRDQPDLEQLDADHHVACWHPQQQPLNLVHSTT